MSGVEKKQSLAEELRIVTHNARQKRCKEELLPLLQKAAEDGLYCTTVENVSLDDMQWLDDNGFTCRKHSNGQGFMVSWEKKIEW